MKRLKELLHNIVLVDSVQDCEIKGIAKDSRNIQPGYLFIAVKGSQQDGRLYLEQALANGAVAVLMEGLNGNQLIKNNTAIIFFKQNIKRYIGDIAARFYEHPSKNMLLIGVTGTNGKSSCTHFIAKTLAQAGKPCGVIGGVGCGFYQTTCKGTSWTIVRNSYLTTPDAIEIHSLLADLRAQKVTIVTIEASSHGLDQERLVALTFTIAAFTNLSHDHLDYHTSFERYAAAKKKLFMQPIQHAIFNIDDDYGDKWYRTFSNIAHPLSVYSYTLKEASAASTHANHRIAAKIIQSDIHCLKAHVTTPWGQGCLSNHQLIGVFNVSNLLLTLTVLNILQIPFKDSLHYISQLQPVTGRMEAICYANKPLVVIDYAHTPDALQKALIALRDSKGRLWCVFGCGGNRDAQKRSMMGTIAERYADKVIITQDNPRNEPSEKIINAILSGMQNPKAAHVEIDRALAIRDTVYQAQRNDTVLIAGKGHETYQTIQGVNYFLSDYQITQKALESL